MQLTPIWEKPLLSVVRTIISDSQLLTLVELLDHCLFLFSNFSTEFIGRRLTDIISRAIRGEVGFDVIPVLIHGVDGVVCTDGHALAAHLLGVRDAADWHGAAGVGVVVESH
jgi:hypothetical protein